MSPINTCERIRVKKAKVSCDEGGLGLLDPCVTWRGLVYLASLTIPPCPSMIMEFRVHQQPGCGKCWEQQIYKTTLKFISMPALTQPVNFISCSFNVLLCFLSAKDQGSKDNKPFSASASLKTPFLWPRRPSQFLLILSSRVISSTKPSLDTFYPQLPFYVCSQHVRASQTTL